MPIDLPTLPHARDALAPRLSARTLAAQEEIARTLLARINARIAGTALDEVGLDGLLDRAQGALHRDAAELWSHAFYWDALAPLGGGTPSRALAAAIERDYGGSTGLRREFDAAALALEGSGWVWLVRRGHGPLAIVAVRGSGLPAGPEDTPLLACDLWEHAYYLDYQDRRAAYLDAFWKHVDWRVVSSRLR
ncbi:superoxide dismutase [Coralloluteibacterium thermophilus]|uniref:Superoxide dismutase n=1 Tax=Coralloluteibacterium thermophilum TaxID=2707049 RepID=A0ABV9NJY1_9GAMM